MFSKILSNRGRLSLAVRLTAWYSTASFLLVALATLALYLALADNIRHISEQMLVDELDVCRALVKVRGGDMHALHEEVEVDSAIRRYQRFYVRVIDPQGRVLATTPGMDHEMESSHLKEEQAGRMNTVFWLESPNGTPYRAIVATVPRDPDGKELWTLQVAVDLTEEQEVLSRHRVWVWVTLAAALIFCPWVGFIIARRGTQPLREVADTARHISSTTLNERINAEGYPEELAALAHTFNDMLQRLEESFARLSRFSADIAHELRTPVNNLRGESEVALSRTRTAEEYRDVLGSCLEEAVRLSELIESLLFLARSESPGDHLKKSKEDLGIMLSDLRDYFEATAAENEIALQVDCREGVLAEVDRKLFQRALSNLVSNALSHSPKGGSITLGAEQRDRQVRIQVRDSGSGIAPEALPRVFDRFYRADPARSRDSGGSGLGLAIVQQIVYLHGGDVQIASDVGRGTTVTVVLPAAA